MSRNKTRRAVPPQITVVDTVGAGDCSFAGLLCSLLHHPEAGWDTHLRASVAAGTGACPVAGANPPSLELLPALLPKCKSAEAAEYKVWLLEAAWINVRHRFAMNGVNACSQ